MKYTPKNTEEVSYAFSYICKGPNTESLGSEKLEKDSKFTLMQIGEKTDCKSFSDYIILLAGAPISWSSKKQPVVAVSFTEEENAAMCHVTKEVYWINNLLKEICVNLISIPQKTCVDNQGAIFLVKNHVISE